MVEVMATYTSGFDLHFTKDITKKDFMDICNLLGSTPEAITGGGFLFMNGVTGYKTMRIRIPNFPWIYPNTIIEWSNDISILVANGTKTSTFLKAFHGASAWTLDELKKCKDILEKFGILCRNMPTKKELLYQ